MRIDMERVGDVTVVEIPGRSLDVANSRVFREAIESLLDPGARIVFDLRKLTFVDSSGLGAMLSCLRDLHDRGGELKLCGMIDSVGHMFSLVRMDQLFDIRTTRDEAVAAF